MIKISFFSFEFFCASPATVVHYLLELVQQWEVEAWGVANTTFEVVRAEVEKIMIDEELVVRLEEVLLSTPPFKPPGLSLNPRALAFTPESHLL